MSATTSSSKQDALLVMVVDDSDDIRDMVKFVLGSQGFSVIEASNGLEAVQAARAVRPHLILMDLSMPVLDGFGAVRQLRQISETSDVPIVAISAHGSTDHRAKASAVGFDGYLTKPIDFGQLIALTQRLLQAA